MSARRVAAALAAAAVVLAVAGGAVLVRLDIAERRAAFQAEARVAQRLLDQRAAQLDAVLATLALLGAPVGGAHAPDDPARRLPATFDAVLAVERPGDDGAWPDAASADAVARALAASASTPAAGRHPVATGLAAGGDRYRLVLAAHPRPVALVVDARRLPPADAWPFAADGPVRAELVFGDRVLVLQPGAGPGERPAGLTPGFTATHRLAAPGQPFELRLQRSTGPAQWPWGRLAGWAAACAAAAALAGLGWRAADERRRGEARLRLAQTARLNALGELAGGLAHELNQPLAAVLASTRTAQRLLPAPDDPAPPDPADRAALHEALDRAATQARRAADVLARLRRLVERPDASTRREPVVLQAVAAELAALLAPQWRGRGLAVTVEGDAPPALGDRVAVEQIVLNLLTNALQAIAGAPTAAGRGGRVRLQVAPAGADRVRIAVVDDGPGVSPAVRARLFEPFVTTRADGLGLGLSLCASLAQAMDGRLDVRDDRAQGAAFVLELPRAP